MASQRRPLGVPLAAAWCDETREWAYGPFDAEGLRDGIWRFHTQDGALHRVSTFARGVRHGAERHYDDGCVVAELHWQKGLLSGPFWRRVPVHTYRIDDVATEVGTFDRGVRIGTLRLLDGSDVEVARFELGRSSLDDGALKLSVLSPLPRPMSAWLDGVERYFAEGRIEEGLVCAARAVAKGADPRVLGGALERYALPVSKTEGEKRSLNVQSESSPQLLLAALIEGAAPVPILRRLAGLDRGAGLGPCVALEMIEAAIAIADDPVPLLFSRGLLRVLAGNAIGARHDARTLRHTRPAEHELLMDAIAALGDEDRKSSDDLLTQPRLTFTERVA